MAQQLTKGVYGGEFGPKPVVAPFGLRCGQCRGGREKLTHNSGWYNKAGEKLGFGDLSMQDFQRIYAELDDDEMFIVLHESDSFWNFVTRPGIIGSMAAVKPDVNAPGVDYVAEHCAYVVDRNGMYLVDEYGSHKETMVNIQGLSMKVLTREAAKALIVSTGVQTTPSS